MWLQGTKALPGDQLLGAGQEEAEFSYDGLAQTQPARTEPAPAQDQSYPSHRPVPPPVCGQAPTRARPDLAPARAPASCLQIPSSGLVHLGLPVASGLGRGHPGLHLQRSGTGTWEVTSRSAEGHIIPSRMFKMTESSQSRPGRESGVQARGAAEPSRPVWRRAAGRLVGPQLAEPLPCGSVPPPAPRLCGQPWKREGIRPLCGREPS